MLDICTEDMSLNGKHINEIFTTIKNIKCKWWENTHTISLEIDDFEVNKDAPNVLYRITSLKTKKVVAHKILTQRKSAIELYKVRLYNVTYASTYIPKNADVLAHYVVVQF